MYTLGPGRAIDRDGVTIAYVKAGEAVNDGAIRPAELDALTHRIVALLNAELDAEAPCLSCGQVLADHTPWCDDMEDSYIGGAYAALG
jgi:hypothetical protein